MYFSYNMADYKMQKASYLFAHSTNISSKTTIPHKHAGIEMFVLLEGKCDCYVENNKYEISNGDIIIVNEDEEHFFNLKAKEFNHIVVGLTNNFFKEHNFGSYADMFFGRNLGQNNFLPSGPLFQYGAHDILSRLENYLNEGYVPENVILSCLTEFLYVCRKAYDDTYKDDSPVAELMHKIFTYIDLNLTEPITLKSIAAHFFISEQYLCRIFKKSVNITVNEYITQKRLSLYHRLTATGMNVQTASEKAGFGSYTAFYRAYKKTYGVSPKKNI